MDENQTTPNPAPGKDSPEKYIRTFAGDMETLQKGGAPDLAPLREPVRAAEPAPIPPPASPVSVPPAPILPPSVPPMVEPRAAELKTYEGDFSEKVKETRASTATILAAEQDSGPRTSSAPQASSRSGLLYVIAGAVLLIVGGAGAYIAYTRYLAVQAPVEPAPTVSAPIFVDERVQLKGSGPELLSAFEQSVAQPLAPNNIRLLYTASTTSVGVFSTSTLPASVPSVLLRNVKTDGSMAGVVNISGTQSPFFILAVASFADTFAGMLAWEPNMLRDLDGLFPPYPAPALVVPVATSTASTTTSKTKGKTQPVATTTVPVAPPAPVLSFHDEVVANHDVRVYRDAAGRSVVLYGYWNQTTLIIARDPAAFAEIIGRLATSRS